MLLDYGDECDVLAAGAWTPLMLAASRGHTGVCVCVCVRVRVRVRVCAHIYI